jgi:6-pyruvoyl-tetrahydropterin synthase
MLDYTSNLVITHDELKNKIKKIVDKMNSRLLLKDWKPSRSQYEALRNELKKLISDA